MVLTLAPQALKRAFIHTEDIMIELTDTARKELESYFADKELSPIRIYLAPGG